MLPSIVTSEPNPGQGNWRIVGRDFESHGGVPILGRHRFTVIREGFGDQAAAERAAGQIAEQTHVLHIAYQAAIVSVVLLAKPDRYVPVILRSNGNVELGGDGLALPMGEAMAKAAEIGQKEKLVFIPLRRR